MKNLRQFIKNNGDYLIALFIILTINFLLPRLLSGNPIDILYGGSETYNELTPEIKQELMAKFGLDQPLYKQFINYLNDLLHLDFGYSYHFGLPVKVVIGRYLPWTLLLVTASIVTSLIIGYLFGITSAFKHNSRFDKITMGVMMSFTGFTQFFIGILLLILFAVKLGWFPIAGCESQFRDYTGIAHVFDIGYHLILPVTTMMIAEVTGIYLLVRNTGIIVKKKPFMLTAEARGLEKSKIMHKYLGKNIMPQLVNFLGLMIGRLFVGALMVELVFAYPGLGTLIQMSVNHRDYPMLQGIFLIIAVMVLLGSFLSEAFNRSFKKI